jgi:hypothetical protein
MASLATFVSYVFTGHHLSPTKAYVVLSLLNMIRYETAPTIPHTYIYLFLNDRFPLAYIPVMIITVSANMVAFGRVQKFLAHPETVSPLPGPNKDKKVLIKYALANLFLGKILTEKITETQISAGHLIRVHIRSLMST